MQDDATILKRAQDFVTACRLAEPDGEYPHVADLEWWSRGGELDDSRAWKFCLNKEGELAGIGIADDGEITSILHPVAGDGTVLSQIRSWGRGRIEEEAVEKGLSSGEIVETACDDCAGFVELLEGEGYARDGVFLARYRMSLEETGPAQELPNRIVVRSSHGMGELEARAALHRRSFSLQDVSSVDEVARKLSRLYRSPIYKPTLDLVAASQDGELAASATFWLDSKCKTGLLEPLCTSPEHRRKGLARSLVDEGLKRLKSLGAKDVLVSARHPAQDQNQDDPYTASRFVFEQAGFKLRRREYTFRKHLQVMS